MRGVCLIPLGALTSSYGMIRATRILAGIGSGGGSPIAMLLHAFCFFTGQTVRPIAYGFGLARAGIMPTLMISAVVIFAPGFACARLLKPTKPADAAEA